VAVDPAAIDKLRALAAFDAGRLFDNACRSHQARRSTMNIANMVGETDILSERTSAGVAHE
jgi:hypothetical protein